MNFDPDLCALNMVKITGNLSLYFGLLLYNMIETRYFMIMCLISLTFILVKFKNIQ